MVMKKLLLCISIVLTACGGGGGTPISPITPDSPSTTYLQPASLPAEKMRLAVLDYRYDVPKNELDSKGNHTTGFTSVKGIVDQIKSVGFNGIVVQTQVPINANTGMVGYFDQYGSVKTLPTDFYKVIEYIKSQQLKVWISIPIADSTNDLALTPNYTKYSQTFLFNNVIAFDKDIAIKAQQYKVDGIFIGHLNCALESTEHSPYWEYLTREIKSVFTGKLSYISCGGRDTDVFKYVDYPAIWPGDGFSTTAIYDLKSVVDLYYNTLQGNNLVVRIKDISKKYNKKVLFLTMPVAVDIGVGVTPPNFWDMLETNVWGNSTYTNLTKYVNYEIQRLKIKAFFEIIGRDLSNEVDGIYIDGYNPWLSNVEFKNPNNAVFLYYCCGSNLTFDQELEKIINYYFSKPWGFYTVK